MNSNGKLTCHRHPSLFHQLAASVLCEAPTACIVVPKTLKTRHVNILRSVGMAENDGAYFGGI